MQHLLMEWSSHLQMALFTCTERLGIIILSVVVNREAAEAETP